MEDLIREWSQGKGEIIHRFFPGSDGIFCPIPGNLDPRLSAALRKQGIQQLYSHQSKAWEETAGGKSIILVTGVASGKTLCFNLRVIDTSLRIPGSRALYLFPTKALAQDQLTQFGNLCRDAGIGSVTMDVYDGDTPASRREAIRARADVVCTNPDMLHLGILPHHTQWREFFHALRWIVIDEVHTYRGVFGSHFANVIRRLKRLCRHYGSNPAFILASATIANPMEHASSLTGESPVLIDEDGSARGRKYFILYNPPVVNRELGIRRPALQVGVEFAMDLAQKGRQTILFAKSRQMVELAVRALRNMGMPDSEVKGYRSGYLPSQRREIETALRDGEARIVASTSALEMGIDIGALDASVMIGYPGSVSSTHQQAGRAGRRKGTSLALMVTSAGTIDQFLFRNPQYLFGQTPEHSLTDPDHVLILLKHLKCAAFELPFHNRDRFGSVSPEDVDQYLSVLQSEGVVHRKGDKYFWMSDSYPANDVSLRSSGMENVTLKTTDDRVIGTVDYNSALWMVHPNAVYIHEGEPYMVEVLDHSKFQAFLAPGDPGYFTRATRATKVDLIEKRIEQQEGQWSKCFGDLKITSQVTGFRKIKWGSSEEIGFGNLEMPPTEFYTTGFWIVLSPTAVDALKEMGMWSDDKGDYGPNWKQLREDIRKRDLFHCVQCGAPETDRQHDVHHIRPLRSFPSYAEANKPENLVTLCQICHRQAEAEVRIRTGLAGFAHVMGNLAPLHILCDSEDIGVHFDRMCPWADGLPTVCIYDMVEGGIGLSRRLYDLARTTLTEAGNHVRQCECADGCPACVGPGGAEGCGGKKEALAILKLIDDVK